MEDRTPAAVVKRTETLSGSLQVVVSCPFCAKEHFHGATDEDHVEGWRSAHCRSGEPYFVTVAEVH